ncbi:MAG: DUF4446 family protein [Candidatus Eremiobacteraeota bacterium]|nr:DUF4446 family protein [Candidatus Eremiobacteraeota bacterium]
MVALAVYHFAVVAPAFGRSRRVLQSHDELIGGGGSSRATDRFARLERAVDEVLSAQRRSDARLDELERVARAEVARVGFVRYNAFDDVGSDLSFALALLNEDGDGVVLSSIYSREETRTYGKAVKGYTSVVDASREERAAIDSARAATLRARTNDTFGRRAV